MFGIDDVLPFVSSAFSSLMSLEGGRERNQSQIEQAENQMLFQERMSNTAYQRAVSDLRAAGLNPMLAYAHGGASTPAGAMANIEDVVTPAINSGRQASQAVSQVQLQREQMKDIQAAAGLKTAQTSESAARTEQSVAEAERARTEAALNLQSIEKSKQDVVHSAASIDLMGKQGQSIVENLQKIAPEIKVMLSQVGVNNAMRSKLLAELPKISAEIPRIKAETDVAYQERLLKEVQTRLEGYKEAHGRFQSDMYQKGGIGYKADQFRKGASVVPGLSWLFTRE